MMGQLRGLLENSHELRFPIECETIKESWYSYLKAQLCYSRERISESYLSSELCW